MKKNLLLLATGLPASCLSVLFGYHANNLKKNRLVVLMLCTLTTSIYGQNCQWAQGANMRWAQKAVCDNIGNVYLAGGYSISQINFTRLRSNGTPANSFQLNPQSTNWGANDIALDPSANVYMTGSFSGTNIDFNPGIGANNLSASNGLFIAKYDSLTNYQWAFALNSGNSDNGYGVATDAASNVYVTGSIGGTVDVDPGTGTAMINSGTSYTAFVAKYNTNGQYQWAFSLPGNVSESRDICMDPAGNIYVIGYFSGGSIDFDPGAGVAVMTPTVTSLFVAKYNSNGQYISAFQVPDIDPNLSAGFSICADAASNIYITGVFSGTVDFDPGTATNNVTAANAYDAFVAKYNSSNQYQWAFHLGSTYDDGGYNITCTAAGDVFVTGSYIGCMDFDPGPGNAVYCGTGSSSEEIFVARYTTNGQFKWGFNQGGPNTTDDDIGSGICLDPSSSSIIVCGYFSTTQDFDHSPGTATVSGGPSYNGFAAKYSQCSVPEQPGVISGSTSICAGSSATYSVSWDFGVSSYSWALPVGWSGISANNAMSATAGSVSGNVSVTASNNCGSSPPQTLAITVNPSPTISVNSGSICSGQSFTISPAGANTYTIQGGNPVVNPGTSTSYTVTGESAAGCVSSAAAVSNVTVIITPTASTGPTQTITCTAPSATLTGSGVSTYTWSGPGIITGTNTSNPIVNSAGVYSLTGSSNGCSSNTSTVNVVSNVVVPAINASTSNTLICAGQSATITASGALTYTFNPGGPGQSIVVSPTVSTTYSVNGTDTDGCIGSTVFTQDVSSCTGLQPLTTVHGWQVYPNPFIGKFTFKSPLAEQVEVYNAIGNLLLSVKTGTDEIEIDLSKEPAGIYMIKTGSGTIKLIKQN